MTIGIFGDSYAQNNMFDDLMERALDDPRFDINETLRPSELRRYYPSSQSMEEAGLQRKPPGR